LGLALTEVLKDFDSSSKAKVNRGIKTALVEVWGGIIMETPVDDGSARGSWFIGETVTDKIGKKSKTKGGNYAKKSVPKDVLGTKLFLYNNLPYIQTLEFGLYPKNPKKGTKTSKKGVTPATYEIRSKGGFSKLAPRGMVRRNLLRFPKVLRQILKQL